MNRKTFDKVIESLRDPDLKDLAIKQMVKDYMIDYHNNHYYNFKVSEDELVLFSLLFRRIKMILTLDKDLETFEKFGIDMTYLVGGEPRVPDEFKGYDKQDDIHIEFLLKTKGVYIEGKHLRTKRFHDNNKIRAKGTKDEINYKIKNIRVNEKRIKIASNSVKSKKSNNLLIDESNIPIENKLLISEEII